MSSATFFRCFPNPMEVALSFPEFWWTALGPDEMVMGSTCFEEEDLRALVQNSWQGCNHPGKAQEKQSQRWIQKKSQVLFCRQPCRWDVQRGHSSLERDIDMKQIFEAARLMKRAKGHESKGRLREGLFSLDDEKIRGLYV